MTLSMAAAGTSGQRRWDPRELSGLKLWVDAADASSITLNGGNVSQWNDKSGGGWHLSQSDSTAQPAYLENTQNGLAVVKTDGSNDLLSGTVPTGLTNVATLWSAHRIVTLGTASYLWQSSNNSAVLQLRTNNQYRMFAGTTLDRGAANTSWMIVTAIYTSAASSASLWQNGTQQGTSGATGSTSPTGTLSLGRPINTTAIEFGEAIWMDGAATTAQRELVEGYLAHKWGLTANLPSGHAYKNIRP